MILAKTCPHCGSHLVVREGQYGEFLACPRFPHCKYTEPISDVNYELYRPPSPYCKKCNYTGRLPFIKDGKVIPSIRLFCDCYEETEHYLPISPDDIDFPCSYDWRSYYQKTFYGEDLPPLEPEIKEEEREGRQAVFGVTSLDLKWRVKELRKVEREFERLQDFVEQNLRIIERKQIPYTVVKLTAVDLEKIEAKQWDKINQLFASNQNLRKQWYEHLEEDREYRKREKPTKKIKYTA